MSTIIDTSLLSIDSVSVDYSLINIMIGVESVFFVRYVLMPKKQFFFIIEA